MELKRCSITRLKSGDIFTELFSFPPSPVYCTCITESFSHNTWQLPHTSKHYSVLLLRVLRALTSDLALYKHCMTATSWENYHYNIAQIFYTGIMSWEVIVHQWLNRLCHRSLASCPGQISASHTPTSPVYKAKYLQTLHHPPPSSPVPPPPSLKQWPKYTKTKFR